jgi:hypothetical protein
MGLIGDACVMCTEATGIKGIPQKVDACRDTCQYPELIKSREYYSILTFLTFFESPEELSRLSCFGGFKKECSASARLHNTMTT